MIELGVKILQHFSDFDKTRVVSLEGAYNVRDMGGFKTSHGGVVRRGLIFRSDELSRLTDADVTALSNIGIKTIVDFRSKMEIVSFEDRCPHEAKILDLSIDNGDLSKVVDNVDDETGPKLMCEVNRFFVREHTQVFSCFFELMTSGKDIPLLFHCAAGKDRTGFAAAMFLSSLGVSREDIFRDYMLSIDGTKKKYSDYLKEKPQRTSIFMPRLEYLTAAYEEIESGFGTVDNYLVKSLGVDSDKMRRIFVE